MILPFSLTPLFLLLFLLLSLSLPPLTTAYPKALLNTITKYSTISDPYPFHNHVKYFADSDGQITTYSIGTNWQNLSKENIVLTTTKAFVTISAANYKSSCIFPQLSFEPTTITSLLKHPSDSGIVNSDGSINKDILTHLMLTHFKYDGTRNIYYLTKSTLTNLLTNWSQRDTNEDKSFGPFLPDSDTVAKFEWDDFFLNYVDYWVTASEPAITSQTFLQFYYDPFTLYQRVLSGELPVREPTNPKN